MTETRTDAQPCNAKLFWGPCKARCTAEVRCDLHASLSLQRSHFSAASAAAGILQGSSESSMTRSAALLLPTQRALPSSLRGTRPSLFYLSCVELSASDSRTHSCRGGGEGSLMLSQ